MDSNTAKAMYDLSVELIALKDRVDALERGLYGTGMWLGTVEQRKAEIGKQAQRRPHADPFGSWRPLSDDEAKKLGV